MAEPTPEELKEFAEYLASIMVDDEDEPFFAIEAIDSEGK